jgi:CheY-like chemotaxis protein
MVHAISQSFARASVKKKKSASRGDVAILTSIDNPMLRTAVRDSLRELGFDNITPVTMFADVRDAMASGLNDLLIISEFIEGQSSLELIRRLRTGELGPHPFPLVLLLMQPGSTTESIRIAINAGPDDVMVMPFAKADFEQRINRMAETRKPFVITYRYTGPDRRTQARIDASPTPGLTAPNPIVIKGRGENFDHAVLQANDSYRRRVGDAGNRMILSLLQEGMTLCAETPPHLPRIERAAVDVVDVGLKLGGRAVGPVDEQVQTVIRQFVDAMRGLNKLDHTQRERVAALGQAFQDCLERLRPVLTSSRKTLK